MLPKPSEMKSHAAAFSMKIDVAHTVWGSGREVGNTHIVLFTVAFERLLRAIPVLDVHLDRLLPLLEVVPRDGGIVDVHPSIDRSLQNDIEGPAQTSLFLFQPAERLTYGQKAASVRCLKQDECFALLRPYAIKVIHDREIEANVLLKFCRTQAFEPLVEHAANEKRWIGVMPLPKFGRAKAELNKAGTECHRGVPALRMSKGCSDVGEGVLPEVAQLALLLAHDEEGRLRAKRPPGV